MTSRLTDVNTTEYIYIVEINGRVEFVAYRQWPGGWELVEVEPVPSFDFVIKRRDRK